jgi:hypothetical protein
MRKKKELTHADLIRLRREKENSQRRQRAATESTRPVPVTSRARQDVVKSNRRSTRGSPSHSARRRFQNALLPVAPDAELRGISISRPQLGKRLPSFIIVALLGTALYLAFNLPQLRVVEAQVIGNQIIPPAEINSTLKIEGRPIFLLLPSELEKQLRLSYPEFVSVNVDVTLPNVVSVNVLERRPIIRWEQGTNYTWVSEDGIAFRPRGENPSLISVVALSAPPMEGNFSPDPLTPAPFISADLVRAIKGFAGHVPPGMQILYDANYGLGWNDPRGWRVYFGSAGNDVELKMRVYESMVTSLTQRGIQPALINVTYPTAPYYRLSE